MREKPANILKSFGFLILLVLPACAPSHVTSNVETKQGIKKMIAFGITRDSVLANFPAAEWGSRTDYFDLRVPYHGSIFFVGFDSMNRANYLTEIFAYSFFDDDSSILLDTTPKERSFLFDSLRHLQVYKTRDMAFLSQYYADSTKDFTFSGQIGPWKAYWWYSDSLQVFQAFSRDSMLTNWQDLRALQDPKRRNTPFQTDNVTGELYLPVIP